MSKTTAAGSTTDLSSNEGYGWYSSARNGSYASSSSAGHDINGPPATSPFLFDESTAKEKLSKYIEICKDKAKNHGFNLQTEIHQVLASKGIILLKKGQFCSELVKHIDAEALLNDAKSDAINRDVKVDTGIYLELATLLRDINDTTDRRALKIKLNHLYEKASKEDGIIIEIFVNLVSKLPNLQWLSPVGEMEPTVNFLDPILSHVFHCPGSNKHLLPLKAENVTLGYVEVKPLDVQSDPESTFMDFANRKALVIQCVGYTMLFYLVSEHSNGITQMAEILKVDVPKEIGEIGGLLQKIDDLKRLFSLYDHQLETQYSNPRILEDDLTLTIDSINPKRRKQKIPSFSLL
ncbi:hypothetical protein CLU79DRAFT_890826 [Phycomyces nitens]|nr:hypothetical protein CLU79DRAFT_890826 [Phycomyces nitens]